MHGCIDQDNLTLEKNAEGSEIISDFASSSESEDKDEDSGAVKRDSFSARVPRGSKFSTTSALSDEDEEEGQPTVGRRPRKFSVSMEEKAGGRRRSSVLSLNNFGRKPFKV